MSEIDEMDGLTTEFRNVLVSHDYGREVYDTTVTAAQIHRLWKTGLIRIDDEHQRGVNTTTGKQVLKKEKVERWTDQLIRDEAVFGQLTWNFRPEETQVKYDADRRSLAVDGGATLPDSAHRHRAIVQAFESARRGSSFDQRMRFSVRIWTVPADVEDEIFYGMNQEGDKADATRSKFLSQRTVGQRIARELVKKSRALTEQNVETVVNTLSIKNPRLVAFNTISTASENAWDDLDLAEVPGAVGYLVAFWDKLVAVRPELGILPLSERRRVRLELVSGSALAIHGFIALARLLRDQGAPLETLEALSGTAVAGDGSVIDFMAFANPVWVERGILVPSSRPGAGLNIRNAIQTRRAITEVFAERVGLEIKRTSSSSVRVTETAAA